jgi:hypothetical protein
MGVIFRNDFSKLKIIPKTAFSGPISVKLLMFKVSLALILG